MHLDIKNLKNMISKISLAVEKSKINPKSGWVELEQTYNMLTIKVSNVDYYLSTSIPINFSDECLHATVLADTFIPLISKLDCDYIDIEEVLNYLNIKTDSNSYTIPLIKELGKTKVLDKINFNCNTDLSSILNGNELASIAKVNAKGLVSAICSRPVQNYIYVDNIGAITYTENIYINDFANKSNKSFKMLLTYSQAKLLEIFDKYDSVNIEFERLPTFNDTPTSTNKVRLFTDDIELILITKDMDLTDSFPSIRLRQNIDINNNMSHVIIDKKLLDKALSRLMIFDKMFDLTVLDYSKIVFYQDHMELVSIKNKNSEIIPYISSSNIVYHESMIRFDDLVKQLKAVSDKELDISYSDRPVIVFNCNIKQLIPEIRMSN